MSPTPAAAAQRPSAPTYATSVSLFVDGVPVPPTAEHEIRFCHTAGGLRPVLYHRGLPVLDGVRLTLRIGEL